MHYYCRIDTSGSVEHTNLQLYSLHRAADEWNQLVDLVSDHGADNIHDFRERLVFIVSCLGLSLSQLLGQNCPSPKKEKLDQPAKLLSALLEDASIDSNRQSRMTCAFNDFNECYGAVRHFGRNKNDQKYQLIDELTLGKLSRFRHMAIEIWDVVIAKHRKNKDNDLDEFGSIADIVEFKESP